HVGGVGVHHQRDLAAALLDVDLDRVGVVGEGAGDVLRDREGAGAARGVRWVLVDAVALGGHLVDEVVVVALVAHSEASSAGASSPVEASAGASPAGVSSAAGAS